ncbi:ParA family protein [Brevibacillus laterosporus]|uniref:ParA family protein n=1 Tax=Brevibacillus laterosporus TaxID=1465 RepID=UPI000EB39603|nr:AAA family ATPase [Brevibacillus laterosporus]AYK05655.1 ParA family protein [Brevibacillus laterosporus]
MKKISIINYKGGVGKTTLSANLAAELAFRNKRVLIVDLDPQANLTFSFFKLQEWQRIDQQGKTIKHWYDAFLDEDKDLSLSQLIVSPQKVNAKLKSFGSTGRLDIINSHLELINVDMELATRYGGNSDRTIRSSFLRLFSRLQKGLEEIKDNYDIVIIDCPPNFNIVTQNAIIASDYYLVPARPDVLSTIGIDQLVRHIDSLTEKYNEFVEQGNNNSWARIKPTMLGVIFSMITIYDEKPISTQREFIRQVKRSYPIFDNYMRDNKTLFAKSPDYGVPVVLDGDVTGIYLDIREELEGIVTELCTKSNI